MVFENPTVEYYMFQCNCLKRDRDYDLIVWKDKYQDAYSKPQDFNINRPALRYINSKKTSRGIKTVQPQDYARINDSSDVILTICKAAVEDDDYDIDVYVSFVGRENGRTTYTTVNLMDYLLDHDLEYCFLDESEKITEKKLEKLYRALTRFYYNFNNGEYVKSLNEMLAII